MYGGAGTINGGTFTSGLINRQKRKKNLSLSKKVNSPSHDRPVTPPHQIVRSTYNQEISINENILIMSAKNLASLDESKVFDDVILTNFFGAYRKYSIVCIEQYLGEFIPLFIKYK